MDITYFPFDSQKCGLKFIAWSYTSEFVNLNLFTQTVELFNYSPNNQWSVKSTSTAEVNTGEAAVYFYITLERKPSFYLINIVIPVILLTLLNCSTFILPVASGERAGFSVTVFLSLAVFLTIVASEMPKNSDNTSLLAIYLMLMTGLSTSIVILCLIQIRISSREVTEDKINKFYMLIYKIASLLCCQRKKSNKVQDLNEEKPSKFEEDQDKTVSWMDIVNAMDLVVFILTLTITAVCTVTILLLAYAG